MVNHFNWRDNPDWFKIEFIKIGKPVKIEAMFTLAANMERMPVPHPTSRTTWGSSQVILTSSENQVIWRSM